MRIPPSTPGTSAGGRALRPQAAASPSAWSEARFSRAMHPGARASFWAASFRTQAYRWRPLKPFLEHQPPKGPIGAAGGMMGEMISSIF
mmetsp:Transcript_32629/g.103928  ORF Transcript_32629/g.103928 Transcript_32629/m.103928 type:complete len:89 (+) Transcript_32629:915-1181(+)